MDITIYPAKLTGETAAIASKSQAHRLLICAAFADSTTTLICPETNRDIEATADCLRSLGAHIQRTENGYTVTPIAVLPSTAVLNCCESGSTLRFMLPIVGALGVDAVFHMEGRLPKRPLSPLWEEMERMGCCLSRPTENTLRCSGRLRAGSYSISGNVSSQYITGLLFAMAMISGECSLTVTGKLESTPYVDMTRKVLDLFGVDTSDLHVHGCQPFTTPGAITVEGDWSNGAFFLAAKAMGNAVSVTGLSSDSAQGDKAAAYLMNALTDNITIDAADIPDLVPILAVTAAAKKGATFTNIGRLRLKESDRVATVCAMLNALGVSTHATEDTLIIHPAIFHSCTIDAANDHRIAMAAAIAATAAQGPVTVLGANCVEKSYPTFWQEYRRLGGNYEFNIR